MVLMSSGVLCRSIARLICTTCCKITTSFFLQQRRVLKRYKSKGLQKNFHCLWLCHIMDNFGVGRADLRGRNAWSGKGIRNGRGNNAPDVSSHIILFPTCIISGKEIQIHTYASTPNQISRWFFQFHSGLPQTFKFQSTLNNATKSASLFGGGHLRQVFVSGSMDV